MEGVEEVDNDLEHVGVFGVFDLVFVGDEHVEEDECMDGREEVDTESGFRCKSSTIFVFEFLAPFPFLFFENKFNKNVVFLAVLGFVVVVELFLLFTVVVEFKLAGCFLFEFKLFFMFSLFSEKLFSFSREAKWASMAVRNTSFTCWRCLEEHSMYLKAWMSD